MAKELLDEIDDPLAGVGVEIQTPLFTIGQIMLVPLNRETQTLPDNFIPSQDTARPHRRRTVTGNWL